MSEHRAFLDRPRRFFLWRYTRGMFSHHALGLSYETNIGETSTTNLGATMLDPTLSLRFFKVEVMYNDKDGLVLMFEGPCKEGTSSPLDHTGYEKKMEGAYTSSLREMDGLCRDVFSVFGDYHELFNNCQHFVTKVIEELDPTKVEKCAHGSFYGGVTIAELSAHLQRPVADGYGRSPGHDVAQDLAKTNQALMLAGGVVAGTLDGGTAGADRREEFAWRALAMDAAFVQFEMHARRADETNASAAETPAVSD